MTKLRRNRRARKRRPPRHYKQGDLDGLCGLYSTVNAIKVLCPEIRGEASADLFDHLMRSLRKAGANPAAVVGGGLEDDALPKVIHRALDFVAVVHGIRLKLGRLPRAVRESNTIDALWAGLLEAISPSCVAVIGFDGRDSHWTVAVGATAQQLKLFDSGSMRVLRRRQCTTRRSSTRYVLATAFVFLIRRR